MPGPTVWASPYSSFFLLKLTLVKWRGSFLSLCEMCSLFILVTTCVWMIQHWMYSVLGIIDSAAVMCKAALYNSTVFLCLFWYLFYIMFLTRLFPLLNCSNCYWLFMFRTTSIVQKCMSPIEYVERNVSIVTLLVNDIHLFVDRYCKFKSQCCNRVSSIDSWAHIKSHELHQDSAPKTLKG